MSPVGRPKAEDPKDIRFSIRLDGKTHARLTAYCGEHNISKGEAIRQGIELLLDTKNKGLTTLKKYQSFIPYTRSRLLINLSYQKTRLLSTKKIERSFFDERSFGNSTTVGKSIFPC